MTRRKLLAFIGLSPLAAKAELRPHEIDNAMRDKLGEVLTSYGPEGLRTYRWTDNDTVLVKL